MATEVYILLAIVVVGAAYVFTRVSRALRFHGKMLVTCPETLKPAAVKVDLSRAATSSVAGHLHLQLGDCSRWPERGECDQDCLVQVERDPEGHRLWTIVSRWFAGKKCTYCGKPIERLSHIERAPALMGLDAKTAQWDEVAAEKLPEIFSTARPVCWGCHMRETFIREHPDLVVTRPWKKSGPLGEYIPEEHTEAGEEHRRTKQEFGPH
jgi:hypothetical protein